MKKSFLITLFILAAVANGCIAKSKKKSSSNISFISMHRSACFGRCPDYTIELYSNGIVKYLGYFSVKDTGVYEKNMGQAKVLKFFKEFESYRVDTCQTNYYQRIADVPGLFYVITYKGKKKEINNAHFGPDFLVDLAREIDAAIKPDASWKKLASEAKR